MITFGSTKIIRSLYYFAFPPLPNDTLFFLKVSYQVIFELSDGRMVYQNSF